MPLLLLLLFSTSSSFLLYSVHFLLVSIYSVLIIFFPFMRKLLYTLYELHKTLFLVYIHFSWVITCWSIYHYLIQIDSFLIGSVSLKHEFIVSCKVIYHFRLLKGINVDISFEMLDFIRCPENDADVVTIHSEYKYKIHFILCYVYSVYIFVVRRPYGDVLFIYISYAQVYEVKRTHLILWHGLRALRRGSPFTC